MKIEELFTLENLNNAYYKCAKISYWKDSTQRYGCNLLSNNISLRDDILNGKYKASKTNNFTINERGKIRSIEAPCIRDRVVQKVLCEHILVPQLTKYLIYDNYASLKNRGTSFARKRIDIMLRRYIKKYSNDGYVLQVDIKKYFDSIDHEVLKRLVHDKIHESEEIMNLIDYIIDTSSDSNKGLNLGSEAPQILAIFYLSCLDNYIKCVKGVKYYGRYMDDMIIISNSKNELRCLLKDIKIQLDNIKLEYNDKKTQIVSLKHGFTFMQIKYSISDNKIIKRPTRSKITRERRRLKKYKKLYDKSEMNEIDIRNCYKSWRNGIIKDCNRCYKSIHNMDKLYNELFNIKEIYKKQTRDYLINNTFNKEDRLYEIFNSYRR